MRLEFFPNLEGEILDRWNRFVSEAEHGHPYHMTQFVEWWEGIDPRMQTYGFFIGFVGEEIRYAAYLFVRPDKGGQLVIEIPHGPVVRTEEDLYQGLQLMREAVPTKYPFFIGPHFEQKDSIFAQLEEIGYSRTSRPWHDATVLIDLTKSEEEIFKTIPSKTRNVIRQAQRKGYAVKMVRDLKSIDDFVALHNEMAKERHFGSIPPELARRMCGGEFNSETRGALFVQENAEGQFLAGAIVLWDKRTIIYHRGVSVKGMPVNSQNLHWQIIKWAKEMNLHTYDLFGIRPDEPDCPVSKFKMSMGKPTLVLPQFTDWKESI